MNIESSIVFADTVGVCVQSDVRSLITTIVEGPIDRHKSRLASCETGDGLTGTYSGGSLDQTESVPKWPREHRARAGLREASRRDKTVRSSSLNHSLSGNVVDTFNHNKAQLVIKFSDRVVRGELYVTSTP